MNKDGRGRPGRIVLKNQPKLKLEDVLRRRRTTLCRLVNEAGITTYAVLLSWCDRMGVEAPTEASFLQAFPAASRVNDPQEGVIVLEAPAIISERTGEPVPLRVIDDAPLLDNTEVSQKKRRTKKDEATNPSHELS